MGFSRQEYWSGLPFPPPGDLPNPGIKLESLMYPALARMFFTSSTIWEAFWTQKAIYKSRLLLRTLFAEKADTHPGTAGLHTALRPHTCGRSITAPRGTSLTGSYGQTWRTLSKEDLLGRRHPSWRSRPKFKADWGHLQEDHRVRLLLEAFIGKSMSLPFLTSRSFLDSLACGTFLCV